MSVFPIQFLPLATRQKHYKAQYNFYCYSLKSFDTVGCVA